MSINTIIKNLPEKSGIYKMLDNKNSVIYVGKASNLKKRVSSYFTKSSQSVKTSRLVDNIKSIETIITKNEEEALILENNLIKKFKPKYNILLRDDKSYPYIYIDTSHNFPLAKFYRGVKSKTNGIYFGPFTEVYKVRHVLKLVQKIFKLRSCENSFFKNRKKPCIQYQINRCDAPCMDYINKSEYDESLQNAILFLQGKNDTIIKNLTSKMNKHSKSLEYEKASDYRDKISMIRSIARPKKLIEDHADVDIISSAEDHKNIFIDIFVIRNGINLGNIPFQFKIKVYMSKNSILDSFIKQYYLKNIPPNKIVLSYKSENHSTLETYLSSKYNKKIKLISSNRKPYSEWLSMCAINSENRMRNYSLADKKNNYLENLSESFQQSTKIQNIICFDISHFSGSNAIGASVWFNKNGPAKNMYRKYNLDHINKSDDYAAMKEILKRRFLKLKNEDNVPDMLIVDGGKGQITQANNVVKELGIKNIIILGLVKGEKRKSDNDRVIDSRYNDITLQISSVNMRLLQSIRDEAHRFAITGQRKRRSKTTYASLLDEVPGIGEVKKNEILNFFGGIQGVLKASVSELSRVPGISVNIANNIHTYLKKK